MNQQVQNKPTAAYILSLLGGIIGLLVSLAFIAYGVLTYMTIASFTGYYDYDYYISDFGLFGWGWTMLLGFGVWMLITSILVLVFAGKLKANPLEHSKWGALILIFSIIGVGGLLGFIGGILALVYKPILAYPQQSQYGYTQPPPPQQAYPQQQYFAQPAPPPQQYPQQTQRVITRICPQCGRVIDEGPKFCPNCGKQLG